MDSAIVSPPVLWTRDITEGEQVVGRINPKEAPRFQIDPTEAARLHRIGKPDLTERDQAEAAMGIHRWDHSDEDSVNGSVEPPPLVETLTDEYGNEVPS